MSLIMCLEVGNVLEAKKTKLLTIYLLFLLVSYLVSFD